ncbi:MAG TPA: CvpA family protein [Tepidisphaeraceae bacterium]|nr:CvpA family protein [Tepidisphaeraceae bacterium]
MIITLLVIVLLAAIAFFHYIQGFFSAMLSAIIAMIASAVAISFHEPVARLLSPYMPDLAHAVSLVSLFALGYGILRAILDKNIPGNVRVLLMVDKIGGAVMGLIAGIFAVGTLVIAIQLLPFGPSIGGYSRYQLNGPQNVAIPIQGQNHEGTVSDALKSETFSPETQSHLLIPVDDIVLNAVAHFSAGALSWKTNLIDIHPSYLDEAFNARLGVQVGAKHTAFNAGGREQQVSVDGLYTVNALPQADGEISALLSIRWSGGGLKPSIQSDPSNMILIVRVSFAGSAADSDQNVRIGTAAVRLLAAGKNHIPMGTLDYVKSAIFVRANRPDDFLIVPADGVVDFVFQISRDELGIVIDPKNKTAPMQIGAGVFLEAKRAALVELAGQEVKREPPPVPEKSVLRKAGLAIPKNLVIPAAPAPAAAPASAPIESIKPEASADFFMPFNAGRYDGDAGDTTFAAGTSTIREKKFAKLEINPTQPLEQIGDVMTREFWTNGQAMVQIAGIPVSRDPWEWAQKLNQFELADSAGKTYKPAGGWAKVKVGPADRVIARYNAEAAPAEVPRVDSARPTDAWIAFLVPPGTALQELRYGGKRIASVNIQAPA